MSKKENAMQGKLFLCATPIGNLEDVSLRVLRTLREVDLIAAEDTRHSIKLLNHFEIKTPLTAYHEHNKIEKARQLVEKMKDGQRIALVTDAGTPGISDPGEELVFFCYEAGIQVTSLPGASACITALSMSGLPSGRFVFEGFLPSRKKERQHVLSCLESESRTIVLYEAPHRLEKTLNELHGSLGNRKVVLCRELTKKFEEVQHITLADAVTYYQEHSPRGEYVLVIEGKGKQQLLAEQREAWEAMPLEEHVALYEGQGMPRMEAMKRVAKDRGVAKREVYSALTNIKL